jgi:hypothetical protein
MKLKLLNGGGDALRDAARYAAMDWICQDDEAACERLLAIDETLSRRGALKELPRREPPTGSAGEHD